MNAKASCYALRLAVRAAKLRYRERIESHFQLNDSRRMWQGLKTICSSGNNCSAEVRADPLLAEELTPSTAASNVMAARLCRSARQEAADRAAMTIMLSPCRRTRFGEN